MHIAPRMGVLSLNEYLHFEIFWNRHILEDFKEPSSLCTNGEVELAWSWQRIFGQ
jgi:hypothetical protein